MQATVLSLNNPSYRDKQGVMLPPKRAYTQHYLNNVTSNPVYNSRTAGGSQPQLHELRAHDLRGTQGQQVHDLRAQHEVVRNPAQVGHDMRGQPHDIRGQSHDLRGQGHDIRGQAHDVRGQPHDIRGQPHDIRGQPHDVRGQPHDVRGQPHDVRTQHDIRGQAHDIRGQPHDVRGQAHDVRAQQLHDMRGQHEVRSQHEVRGQYPGHPDIRVPHEVARSQAQVHESRGQLEVRGQPPELNSPYKRQRTQSPVTAAHPATGTYPYAQTPEGARFPLQGLDRQMYGRNPHVFQGHNERGADFSREQHFAEMPARRRPSMLQQNYEREQAKRLLQTHSHHGPPPQPQHAVAAPQPSQAGGQAVVPPPQQQQPPANQQPVVVQPGPPPPSSQQQEASPHHGGFKKQRIMEMRPDLTQPLCIDTRDTEVKRLTMAGMAGESTYTPQVEAISPTLPPEDKLDDVGGTKSSKAKEELLQNINKIDKELAKLEQTVGQLKKKQQHLEEQASKPPEERTGTPEPDVKPQSIAQVIYAENRKKAAEAHATLDKLAPRLDSPDSLPIGAPLFPIQPLYNQPSDTVVYHDNKRRHAMFKRRLLLNFKKKHQSQRIREKYLMERYDQLLQQWVKKVEAIENRTKRRIKDAKTREQFEKVFPELRKQREDKERFQRNRGIGVVKSEAEMEQIIGDLHEAEEDDKKMRSYAVVPPMLLDARQRKLRFHNNNGFIEDPKNEHKERQNVNLWTDHEVEIFKDKYLQHPKNFGFISSFLEKKTVQDCVQYYYLSKKNQHYKQLVKKLNVKKRKIAKVQEQTLRTKEIEPPKKEQEEQTVPIIQPNDKPPDLPSSTQTDVSMVTSESISSNSSSNNIVTSTIATSSVTPSNATSKASPAPPPVTNDEGGNNGGSVTMAADPLVTKTTTQPPHQPPEGPPPSVQVPPGPSPRTPPPPNPPTEAEERGTGGQRGIDGLKGAGEETENQMTTTQGGGDQMQAAAADRREGEGEQVTEGSVPLSSDGGSHKCAVCKTEVSNTSQSRPLLKTSCVTYEIAEADWTADMRVCSSCHCKGVSRRYTPCPVPSCKNPKRRIKRLRPLPQKLQELPRETKEAIYKELQLHADIVRCCSACFNRIARKMGNNPNTNEPLVPLVPDDEVVETPRWSEEEMEVAKQGLRDHGRDWGSISQMVGTKSEAQCKNFYFNYKKKFSLETLIQEYKKNKAEDKRKISVCESVASTISVDHPSEDDEDSSDNDDIIEDNDVSDTDSAPSPRPPSEAALPPVPLGQGSSNTSGGSRAATPILDRKRMGAELTVSDRRRMEAELTVSDRRRMEAELTVSDRRRMEAELTVSDRRRMEGELSGQAVPSIIPTPSAGDTGIQAKEKANEGYDSSATLSADEGSSQGEGGSGEVGQGDHHHHKHHHSHHDHHKVTSGGQVESDRAVSEGSGQHHLTTRPSSTQPFLSYSSTTTKEDSREGKAGSRPSSLPESPKGEGLGKNSSPPCVRDLIHTAIERNLQMETSVTQGASAGHTNPTACPNRPSSSGSALAGVVGTGQSLQQQPPGWSPREPMLPPGRHSSSPLHPHQQQQQLPQQQHPTAGQQPQQQPSYREREVKVTVRGGDRPQTESYRGDPMAYDPRDPKIREAGLKFGMHHHHPAERENTRAAPPPAHSHPSPSPHAHLMHHHNKPEGATSGRIQTAEIPHDRARSPAGVPASHMRPASGPYSMEHSRPDYTGQSRGLQAGGRTTQIGLPPPLINISDHSSSGVGGSSSNNTKPGRMSPARYTQSHTAGSISQGIPPPSHSSAAQIIPRSSGGSISMGTPHFEASHRHQQQKVMEGGSITQGTPLGKGYEHPPSHHGSSNRGIPPPPQPIAKEQHKSLPGSQGAKESFEQLLRQLSPTSSSSSSLATTSSGYGSMYGNPTELQQRSTLMGDYLTAKQMKDDRRPIGPGDPHDKQHSPRGGTGSGGGGVLGPAVAADASRLPLHYVIDPRDPQAAAYLQKHQAALLHPGMQPGTAGAAVDRQQQRVSPLPTAHHASGALSPHAQAERESMSTLQTAFEMRDMMQQSQHQQQHKAAVQHSPSMKSHAGNNRERSPPPQASPGMASLHHLQQHHGVIKEVPHNRDARSIVMGSASGPITSSSSAPGERAMQHHHHKDVHYHQSEEQAQFINRNRPESEPEESQVRKQQARNIQRAMNAMPGGMDQRMRRHDLPGYGGTSSHSDAAAQQPSPHHPHHHHPPQQQHHPSRSNSDPTEGHHHQQPQQQHRSSSGGAAPAPSGANNAQYMERHPLESPANISNNSSNTSGENGKAPGMKTLTAASLIDIIITNQINSNVNKNKPNSNILGRLEDTRSPDERVSVGEIERASPHQHPGHPGPQASSGAMVARQQGGITSGMPHAMIQGRPSGPRHPGDGGSKLSPYKEERLSLEEQQGRSLSSRSPRPHSRGPPTSVDPSNQSQRMQLLNVAAAKGGTLGEHIDSIIVQDYTHKTMNGDPAAVPSEKDVAMQRAVRSFMFADSNIDAQPFPLQAGGRAVDWHLVAPPLTITNGNHRGTMVPTTSNIVLASKARLPGAPSGYPSYPNHMGHLMPTHSDGQHRKPMETTETRPPSQGHAPHHQQGHSQGHHDPRPSPVHSQGHRESLHSGQQQKQQGLGGQGHRDVLPTSSSSQGHREGYREGHREVPIVSSSSGPYYPGPSSHHHQPVGLKAAGVSMEEGAGRPRSHSMGATGAYSAGHMGKLKRALQPDREAEMLEPSTTHPQVHCSPGGPPQQQVPMAQPARSPMMLQSDEREIVKVARGETATDVHNRSPRAGMLLVNRSPGSSVEENSKPGSPRSPRGGGALTTGQPYGGTAPRHMAGDHSNSDSVLEIMNSKISEAISNSPMKEGGGGEGFYRRSSPTISSDKNRTSDRNSFLRQRYYREQTSPKKEEQANNNSSINSTSSNSSNSNIGNPQTSASSNANYESSPLQQKNNNGGSPTASNNSLSRPSSRSSTGIGEQQQLKPLPSPISSSEAYRYSPRGRLLASRQHMEGSSPYPTTPHQSPSSRVVPPTIPSPHAEGGGGSYSRSNSGGSSSGSRVDSVGESPRASPQVKYLEPPPPPPGGAEGGGGASYMQQQHEKLYMQRAPQASSSSSGGNNPNQSGYGNNSSSKPRHGSPEENNTHLQQQPAVHSNSSNNPPSNLSPTSTSTQIMGYGPTTSPRQVPSSPQNPQQQHGPHGPQTTPSKS